MRASVSRTIGVGDHLDRSARLARRLRPVPGKVPPAAEGIVVGHARRDRPQHVEALLDRVRIQCDRSPGLLAADSAPIG